MTDSRRVQNTQAEGSGDASTFERLLRAMQDMEARMDARMDTLEANAGPQAPPSPPPVPAHDVAQPDRRLYSDFQKRDPPTFVGLNDPIRAMEWLNTMRKIFRSFPCSEDEQVRLATDKLRNSADKWWEATRSRLAREGVRITWDMFQERFVGKYISQDALERKEAEFQSLTQGNLSVTEYANRFEELLSFCESGGKQYTESELCTKFQRGLVWQISHVVVGHRLTTLQALVDQCLLMEESVVKGTQGQARMNASWTGKGKGRARNVGKDKGQASDPGKGKGLQAQQNLTTFKRVNHPPGARASASATHPLCSGCNRRHFGECRMGANTCFKCGKTGHYVRDCPAVATPTGNDL